MIRPGFRQTDKPEYQYISQKDINKKLEKPKWVNGTTADGYIRPRFYQPPVNGRMIFDFDRHKAIDIEKNGALVQMKFTTSIPDEHDNTYKAENRKQRSITKQMTFDELIKQNLNQSLKTIEQAIMDNKNSTEQGKKEIIDALILNLGRSKADPSAVNAIAHMAKHIRASTNYADYGLPQIIDSFEDFNKLGTKALFYLLSTSKHPDEVAYKANRKISIYNMKANFNPSSGDEYYLDLNDRYFKLKDDPPNLFDEDYQAVAQPAAEEQKAHTPPPSP